MSSPLQDGSIATNDVIEAVHINQLFPILADLEDGKAFFRPDQGSANAYQVDFSGTPSNKNQFSAYHQGMLVIFKAANTNTGASTLQVVGPSGNLTALPLTKSGSVALEAGDIQAGQMVAAVCNDLGGGNFRFEMVGAPAVNLTPEDIPSGVDAAKIGAGSVSNTEFGYLDGVTSGIQAQLDGKAPSSHTHAASDIASGQVALARGGTGSDLSATGGAGQVLKQTSAGGAVSVSALTASDMPSSIDASKIGSGSVSNTEFGYLDGVTSSLQAQLDGKAASSHTHPASDIASGQVALARGGTGSDLSATGGAGQVLKQTSAGGAVSVSALTASDMPNLYGAVLGTKDYAQGLTPGVWNPIYWNHQGPISSGVIHSTTSQSSRITPGRTGWYVVHTKVHIRRWSNQGTQRQVKFQIFVNGIEAPSSRAFTGKVLLAGQGEDQFSTSSLVFIQNESDYFEVRLNPDGSHSWDIWAWFTNLQFYWLGGNL